MRLRAVEIGDEPGSNYLRVSVECRPVWDRIGRHRPTVERGRAMFEKARQLDLRAEQAAALGLG
jgi:hypothetical protein